MSDANIPALLEELKEVDFETWNTITIRCRFIETSYATEFGQDFIQGCIQRAIAARLGNWIMSMWTCPAGWQAMIRRGRRGYTDPEYMHIGSGDIPAAAILAAYIEAVRARQ